MSKEQINETWHKLRKNLFNILIILPAFLYLIGFFIVILYSLLILSVTKIDGAAGTFPTLYNYVQLLNNTAFWDALKRTAIFVAIGTPMQLLAGLLLALLIYKPFKGNGIVRSIYLIPIAIPALVTTVILTMLFSYPFGHINDLLMGRFAWFPKLVEQPINWPTNEFLGLGIAMMGKIWRDMPISMLILLAGLQSINEEQYEAAETMGAGKIQQFFYITIPLLVPAISSVLILRSIETWKEFIFPYIIAPSYPLLGVLIDNAYHVQKNPALAAAIAIILIILIAISTFLLNFILKKIQSFLVSV